MTDWLAILTEILSNPFIQASVFILFIVLISSIFGKHMLVIVPEKLKTRAKIFFEETFFFRRILAIGAALALLAAIDYTGFNEKTSQFFRMITSSFIIFICYLILRNFINSLFNFLQSPSIINRYYGRNKNLFDIFYKISHIALILIGVTAILSAWNIQLGPVLAGLGIAGLAVGLALQESLSNIFGGISLILDNAYSEDEYVELSSGESGIIYSVGYRSTKIKTGNDEIIIVPNSKLAQMNIKNLSRPTQNYRLTLDISVEYSNDINKIKDILLTTIKKTDGILDFPEPEVFFLRMGSSSLDFKLLATIRSPLERMSKTDAALTSIYQAFQENGIKIPYPTSTVYLHREK